MNRNVIQARSNWQRTVESQGLEFHTPTGDAGTREAYWNESAYYTFTMDEVNEIERASRDLFELCLEACQHVIDQKRYAELTIPAEAIPLIENSWEAEPPSLYGRFDFSMQDGVPKMLELNADTPTSLLESAIIQWMWKQEVFPQKDQYNSLHEALVAKWRDIAPYLPGRRRVFGEQRLVHFAAMNSVEDLWTVAYLAHTAECAGIKTVQMQIGEIGWNEQALEFRDMAERTIRSCFKLYPWEFLLVDEFGRNVLRQASEVWVREMKDPGATLWIEPPWKMLLSNKGILPILWELHPECPYLLRATFDEPSAEMWGWAKKPLLSREGANVMIRDREQFVHQGPDAGYGSEGFIFQDLAPLPTFAAAEGTQHAVVGAWVVDGQPCGMGIRESSGPITGNRSRFVPHIIDG